MKYVSNARHIAIVRLGVRRRRKSARRRGTLLGVYRTGSTLRLCVPQVVNLVNQRHRAELVKFLSNVKQQAIRHSGDILIDFSQTKSMISCGTLLLLAELSDLQQYILRKKKAIRLLAKRSDSPRVNQILKHVGIFELLQYECDLVVDRADVVHWRYVTGDEVKPEHLHEVMDEIECRLDHTLARRLGACIAEAMTNVSHHAYIGTTLDPERGYTDRRWWFFSQLKGDEFIVVICDLGVGIPETIRQSFDSADKMKQFFGRLLGKDARHIRAAIELGRSRTNEVNRGKGLEEMRRTIQNAGHGSLTIFSEKQMYCYDGVRQKHHAKDYQAAVKGTIVQWVVPVGTSS